MRHREAIGSPQKRSPGAQLPAEGRPQGPEDGGAGNGFDWWKAPKGLRDRASAGEPAAAASATEAGTAVGTGTEAGAGTEAAPGSGSEPEAMAGFATGSGVSTPGARKGTRSKARAGSRTSAKSGAAPGGSRSAGRAGTGAGAGAATGAAAKSGAGAVTAAPAGPVGSGPEPGPDQPSAYPAAARVPEQGHGPGLEAVVQAAAEADAAFDREQSRLRAAHAEVYRHVHDGEEFQLIRRSYRGFVFPACAAFLLWYLGYIVAAVTLPGLMARPVAGPFNVAWLLALLQFVTTFLLTWLYARHARDRRDRAALGLRWETQDRLR